MQLNYTTDKKINQDLLAQFVLSVDRDFHPPLQGRVDIVGWIDKIMLNGEVAVAEKDHRPVGMVAFYANNTDSKAAYISYVAVSPECRKQGAASQMLNLCFRKCIAAGMNTVRIHTNNPAALRLYTSLGFNVINREMPDSSGFTRTLLEKKL